MVSDYRWLTLTMSPFFQMSSHYSQEIVSMNTESRDVPCFRAIRCGNGVVVIRSPLLTPLYRGRV